MFFHLYMKAITQEALINNVKFGNDDEDGNNDQLHHGTFD